MKLSQCIEVRSKVGNMVGQAHGDSEFLHQTFPFFIWLLRDVTQKIPRDCKNLKDYFLKKVYLSCQLRDLLSFRIYTKTSLFTCIISIIVTMMIFY